MEPHERAREITNQAVEFERFALALLSAEALAQGKTLLVGNELPRVLSFADAFAPSGIYDLPGPCFVEVKLKFTDRVLASLDRARTMVPEDPSFLIVLRDGRFPRERFSKQIAERFPDIRVQVIGREELDELAAKHPAAALPFAGADLNRALSSFKARSADHTRANEQHLNALRSAYNDDRLALVIGAGVSKSAGFPDWSELVRRIAATVFDNHSGTALSDEERMEIQAYFEAEVPASPLIVARLLRNSLRGGFADAVRGALYRGAPTYSGSPLLDEIASLCMPKRDRLGIVAVVNYNFDDLVEGELKRRGIAYRPIFTEGDKPLRSELPIFHVHGFLPRAGHLSAAHQASLVLSEDAYHTQFVDPFVWPNITQLNLLRTNVCLFVGVSMTDPNQRRLLEITASKDSSVRHYAIMKDHWTGTLARRLSPNAKSLAQVFKGLEEASLASLGVSVMWVDDFDDMPRVLASIRR